MSDPIKLILAIGIMAVLLTLFFVSFLLNKKTPKPEGCVEDEAACSSCTLVSCGHHPSMNETKGE
ncbi:MAG: hypothetical protein EOM74_04955 [Methanomicrobia archaeon]|nr:hypothetical protein [Methanomicrobia archaeon]